MYDRGAVVVASDPFGNTPRRPYLLISGQNHPFSGEQYVALGITTKSYDESLPVDGSFESGELRQESFVSPWAVVSLRDVDIDRAVARLSETLTDRAAERTSEYILD